MKAKSAPILIMAGGTGGHVFPALAIADALKAAGEQVIWLGTKKGLEARVVPNAGYDIEWLGVTGLRGKGIVTLALAPVKLLHAMLQAGKILIKHKPKAVLGMGGFVSGPGGLMAWLLDKPLFVHEQNSVVGLTNQWLSRVCDHVFYGFLNPLKQTKAGTYVGNPVRQELLEIEPREQADSFNLLVIGGSLGAAQLNKMVPKAIQLLKQKKIHVIHQCGERHLEAATLAYEHVDAKVEVRAFIDDMKQAYEWADFIICRSGALTVAEISNVGLASILVPYPYAVDDHQSSNAKQLEDAEAAVIVKDSELTAESLAKVLEINFLDSKKRISMSKNAKKMAMPDATQSVVNHILRAVA